MMLLVAVFLLAAVAPDEKMEQLLQGLRSDDPAVRANANDEILASWSHWKEGDLSKLEEASRDHDPEVSGRAAEARARIRIRRSLGTNLFRQIAKADDAFLAVDDDAKLTVLAEAKRIWKAGKLEKGDLAGLETLAMRAPWTDPTALDRFLKDPDASQVFSVPANVEGRVRARTRELEFLGKEGRKRAGQVAEFLTDGEAEVRRSALQVIGGMEARDQTFQVGALLKDGNAGVRGDAMALLGKWGARQFAADFKGMLEDPSPALRWRATEVLGAWGQRDAAPQVATLLRDSFAPSRAEAAMVLGAFGAREFAADVAPLLADPKPSVRRSAAYALGKFGSVEYAGRIKALLKDPDPGVRLTAAQALGQFGEVPGNALCDLLHDEDPEVRVEAAWVLGFTAPPDALTRISLFIKDSDAETRRHAVWMVRLLKARDFRIAVAGLLDDPSAWVRSEAVLTLGRIGAKEDGPRMAALLLDPDRKVRVQAALALGELGAIDAGGVLAPLERDQDRLLGLSSTLSLARLGKGRPGALRQALAEIAADDVAFASLGTAASEVASYVHNREAWDLLDRPLPMRRSVESWTDLTSVLSDAGLTLEVQADCTIGRLDKNHPLTGWNALSWLLGRFSVPATILEGRKIRLVDRRSSLSHWLKQLEGK